MNTIEVVNGKRYWVEENGNNAIWCNKTHSFDIWMIGSKSDVGTLIGGIYTVSENQCPNDEINTWKYVADDKWVDAGSDIEITCVIDYRIMNTNEKQVKNIEQKSKLPYVSKQNHQKSKSRVINFNQGRTKETKNFDQARINQKRNIASIHHFWHSGLP